MTAVAGHVVRSSTATGSASEGCLIRRALEQIFYGYKGMRPSNHPKARKFVDAGSSLCFAPKSHAYVSKEVRDASLTSMIGTSQDEGWLKKKLH